MMPSECSRALFGGEGGGGGGGGGGGNGRCGYRLGRVVSGAAPERCPLPPS